jgi:cytochrome P450
MTDIDATSRPFPFSAESMAELFSVYADRRAACPMGRVRLASGHDAVLVVTYRDAVAALGDPRLSHDLTAPGSPRVVPGPSFLDMRDGLLNKDGEEHLRVRRIVASAFTPRRIERWKPVIESVAAELLDAMEKSGSAADLVASYCIPLPMRIICKLLGVPDHDIERFRDWSNAFLSAAKMTPERRVELLMEFAEYTVGLIAQRRAEPGNDLIDDMIAARDGSDRLSEAELLSLSAGLIAAGNETTSNALGRSVLALLRNDRELWEQLVGKPDLLPAAVDELLRTTTADINGSLRLAVEDVELPSGTVKAGEAVVISTLSSHRDETMFPDANAVRFDRAAPPSLTFGGGPHYCLGAHLAKAELRIGLGLLIERFPELRLAEDPEKLRYTEGDFMSSLVSMQVAW